MGKPSSDEGKALNGPSPHQLGLDQNQTRRGCGTTHLWRPNRAVPLGSSGGHPPEDCKGARRFLRRLF